MSKGDSVSLRYIIDTVSAIRGSLLSLGSELDIMNAIIIHIVLSKLDDSSKQNYDEKLDFRSLPSWDTCYDILSHRCQFLESHGKKSEQKSSSTGTKPKSNFSRNANTFLSSNTNTTCSYCNSSGHHLAICSSFLSLVVSERFNFVKRNGHCINCLRKGHLVSKCPSSSRCRVCQSAHHTSLHIFVQPESAPVNPAPPETSTNNATSLVARSFKRAIIPTAVVLIKDSFGCYQPVRVLLDSCSEINFITEETAKKLKLRFLPNCQDVSGISEIQTKIRYSVAATIKSRIGSFQWSSTFAVTKSISAQQPGEKIDTTRFTIPETIQLADPLFYKPQRIDLLISTEIFFDLLLEGRISLGHGMPCLVNTVFGWIVGGKFNDQKNPSTLTCNLALDSSTSILDNTLRKFWEVEEYVSGPQTFTNEEQACEKHFTENVQINSDRRIQVRLPFKQNPNCLGESFEISKRRFLSLERKLERDPTLKSMYVDFVNEYLALGHMSLYNRPLSHPHYIIPHHCVLKPESTTTKLRVVFDGSARTTSNHSLNDILMVGPTIQQDLVTTLFSFRLNRFALTADISKMYRQFLVDERDRKFQLVLWRSNSKDKLCVFQLNTVTYGLSAAPFLAIRSLFFIADQHSSTFPIGSKVLREDLYVDDVLTGSDSLEILELKKSEIIKILSIHGLQLAKWNSNCPDFVTNNDEEVAIKTTEENITKTLGMSWNPTQDIFLFRFNLPDIHSSTLNCFVANRVSELQEQAQDVIWRHVPSKSNPADIVSRGCSATDLPSTIWFNGPKFIFEDVSNWPANITDESDEILERRKTALKCTTNDITESVIDEIIDKCKVDPLLKANNIIHLPPQELENTFWKLVAHIQSKNFVVELNAILNNNLVQPSLQKLAPFVHQMETDNKTINLIRVGGRLSKAPIPYDARFPALLPKNHRFVKLYIEHLHRLHLHAGPKVLLGILRQKIWIINAREVVRKVVRNCVHCFHYKPKLIGQIMGNLPVDRLRAQRPFLVSGVDFCGPFLTSYRIRGKVPYKTYVAVFVCFSSKATHLELVSDLSTNNFILCLNRFVSRRGLPQRIFCDNATNFTGAHNKLKELKDKLLSNKIVSEIKTHCTQNGFEFCFIPPRAPHFGGLWEAAVKSAKTLLVKNLAQARLTFEELQTLIVEIEAILNSRPIAPMSDDPNDGEALTPGHLLIGSSLVSIPQETFDSSKLSALNRWQQISYLKNQFWQLWSRDYLLSLQQRSKWSKTQPNINIGQLVIIHEDNTPTTELAPCKSHKNNFWY
ncbi:uncharacterized protein LOC111684781 [Lucilia cuprina]|uniref:uncharacterized protein LOC111684781 n=1 Tax=Lucilia cuprina TaxID=7375 RepID=UPI001F062F1C|nr:uncharacterized protein LOC111684781 [Lucilia cuprina]